MLKVTLLVTAVFLILFSGNDRVQSQDAATSNTGNSRITEADSDTKSTWDFGLEVRSVGEAKNVTGAFPVPMEWPEQTLTQSKPIKTENVSRVVNKDYVTAKMVEFEIPRMTPGETARCVIRCEVTKRVQAAREDVDAFRFVAKPGHELKPFLRASPQIESTNPKIVKLAMETIEFSESDSPWQQVETIYDWVRDNIEYRFEETNRPAIEALNNKRGDCGEMTGLFVAICRARGIPARSVWIPHHAYPEFYLEDEKGQGHWLPCQVAGQNEFGKITEMKPVIQKGDHFQIRGQKQPVRYVQPTLTARQANAPLQIKFIMEKVADQ